VATSAVGPLQTAAATQETQRTTELAWRARRRRVRCSICPHSHRSSRRGTSRPEARRAGAAGPRDAGREVGGSALPRDAPLRQKYRPGAPVIASGSGAIQRHLLDGTRGTFGNQEAKAGLRLRGEAGRSDISANQGHFEDSCGRAAILGDGCGGGALVFCAFGFVGRRCRTADQMGRVVTFLELYREGITATADGVFVGRQKRGSEILVSRERETAMRTLRGPSFADDGRCFDHGRTEANADGAR